MSKKIVIYLVVTLILVFAGFYFYTKSKIKTVPPPSDQVTTVADTRKESEKETMGEITYIDNSHLKLKEIIKDKNCFDSMKIDVENDPDVKEKSLQNMKGIITDEEWTKFFTEKVNKKYNNNLPWCPGGAIYNETGKEITFVLNNDTIFTTFSFEDSEHPVWDKMISKEYFIQGYNTSDAFHSRVEITSKGLNAIKVHLPYQE